MLGSLRRLAERPVTAAWMHRCRLDRSGGEPWTVSVFPFFDAEGVVHKSMVVRWDRPELYVTRSRYAGLQARRSGFGRVVACRQNLSRIKRIELDERIGELGRLWHFDPWWVLGEAPFSSFSSTPILKRTNCVDHLPDGATSMSFDWKLTQVAGLTNVHGSTLPLSLEQRRRPANGAQSGKRLR